MNRRRLASAGLLAAGVLVAGCSSSKTRSSTATTAAVTTASGPSTSAVAEAGGAWVTYDHDVARSGVADDQAALGQVRKAWDSPALDGAVYAQPLVIGAKVLVATEANSLYALDAATGQVTWRGQLGQPVPAASLPAATTDAP